MDRKTYAIGILSITAALLLIANLLPQNTSVAATVAIGRDYQAATTSAVSGGESLFVLDNKTGLVAVFSYDPTSRTVVPRAVRSVGEAFGTQP